MGTYDGHPPEEWLKELAASDLWNARHLLAAFALLGIPNSYADFGCGTGAMVLTARKLGVRAYGVDQLVDEKTWPGGFYHRNLVDAFALPDGAVELVTCLEVAEHLHESSHATFCDTLCRNLQGGHRYLIFSAARPGQGGTGHVACRPAEYWHHEFTLRGLSFDHTMTLNLALLWSNIESPLQFMWDNLMVFHKGTK